MSGTSSQQDPLPEHLWSEVLLFLSEDDLPAVREVNRTLSKLCNHLEEDICGQSERALVLDHLQSTYSNAGYREGMEETENKLLQVGFYQGFSKGAVSAYEMGIARGTATAAILFAQLFGSTHGNATPAQTLGAGSGVQSPTAATAIVAQTPMEQKLSSMLPSRLRRNRQAQRTVAVTIDEDESFGFFASPIANEDTQPLPIPAEDTIQTANKDIIPSTSQIEAAERGLPPTSSVEPQARSQQGTVDGAASSPLQDTALSALARFLTQPSFLHLPILLCASLTAHAKQMDLPPQLHSHARILSEEQWRAVATLCAAPKKPSTTLPAGDRAVPEAEGQEHCDDVGVVDAELVATAVDAANNTSISRPGVPFAHLSAPRDAGGVACSIPGSKLDGAEEQCVGLPEEGCDTRREINPYSIRLSAPSELRQVVSRMFTQLSIVTRADILNALYRRGVSALRKHNRTAQREKQKYTADINNGRECFHDDHFHGIPSFGNRYISEEDAGNGSIHGSEDSDGGGDRGYDDEINFM